MNVVKCKNGHFYDSDVYNVCPHCGAAMQGAPEPAGQDARAEKKGWWHRKEKQEPVPQPMMQQRPAPQPMQQRPAPQPMQQPAPQQPANPVYDPFVQVSSENNKGKTYSLWNKPAAASAPQQAPRPVAQPVPQPAPQPAPRPVAQPVPQPAPQPAPRPVAQPVPQPAPQPVSGPSLQDVVQKASANSEGKTMSYFNTIVHTSADEAAQAPEPIDPVVGWLVCTGGPHLGASFVLHAGKNTIGRNAENDLVLDRDKQVSRSRHATVIYEPKKRDFYLQPGDASGLVYYNGDYTPEIKKMENRARIELGESEFIFVPLCGEDFTWEDKLKKE